MAENNVRVIDGASKANAPEDKNPSLDEEPLEELDVIPVDGEEPAPGKDKKEPKPKGEQPPKKGEDGEEPAPGKGEEEPDGDEELVDEEPADGGAKPNADEEEVDVIDEDYDKSLNENIQELRRSHDLVALASESIGDVPKRPDKSEDDDPESWEQYRSDMSAYKIQKSTVERQKSFASKQVNEIAAKQEILFRDKHKNDDIGGFESWFKNNIEIQAMFFTGKRSLEKLYTLYKVDVGEYKAPKKVISDAQKKGKKFKPVNSRGGGDGGEPASAGGFDAKYKYANLPQYKKMANQMLKEVNPFTGHKPTIREVNELIKNEYLYDRGKLV